MPFEEPLAFKVEWFDVTSGLHRQFNLSFYESDKSVEMVDIKSRKMFLRRCPIASSLDKKELFVGNTVVVFSRHLLIKDFANEYTKSQVEDHKQTTLVLIYPEAHAELGHVLKCFERAGYHLVRARSLCFTQISAVEFLDRFRVRGVDITKETKRLSNPDHPSIGLEIVGPNVITAWRNCLRPSVTFEAETFDEEAELSIRGIYGSPSLNEAEWELRFIFNQKSVNVGPWPPVQMDFKDNDVTCCVIKPHALRSGLAGQIIEEIQTRGFYIFGFQTFILSKKETEDFYEIYKGMPGQDYAGMIRQGASGKVDFFFHMCNFKWCVK